jgi:hypothetical protein
VDKNQVVGFEGEDIPEGSLLDDIFVSRKLKNIPIVKRPQGRKRIALAKTVKEAYRPSIKLHSMKQRYRVTWLYSRPDLSHILSRNCVV